MAPSPPWVRPASGEGDNQGCDARIAKPKGNESAEDAASGAGIGLCGSFAALARNDKNDAFAAAVRGCDERDKARVGFGLPVSV